MTTPTSTAAKRTAAKKAASARKSAPPAKKAARPQPAQRPALPAPADKPKHKLVRDSFTIPKLEYTVLEALKQRAANLKRPTKKSELIRAGISALKAMDDKAFLSTLSRIPSLKTGRPKVSRAK